MDILMPWVLVGYFFVNGKFDHYDIEYKRSYEQCMDDRSKAFIGSLRGRIDVLLICQRNGTRV